MHSIVARARRNCSIGSHARLPKTSVVAITSAQLRRIVLETSEKFDPAAHAMAVSALVRTGARIGLQRVSLQNYLAPPLCRHPYRTSQN